VRYDVTHFETLGRLLDLERNEEEQRHRALTSHASKATLIAQGLMLPHLTAVEENVGFGGRVLVTLERTDKQSLGDGFDTGEVVDVCAGEERVRAIIARRRTTALELAFDEPPPPFVQDEQLDLIVAPNDVTYRRAKSAIAAVRGMEKGAERRRRDILLGTEPPRTSNVTLGPLQRTLNPEQTEALKHTLEAEDVFLVHGPPGTGKSTVLGEIAYQAVRDRKRLVACAASNAAVDHLVSICIARGLKTVRVGHPARVAEHLHPYVLDVLAYDHPDAEVARNLFDEALELKGYARKQRNRGRSKERFSNAREAGREAGVLFKEARELEKRAARAILDDADVVCATLTALGGFDLANEEFDLALFDEATQATEPLSLLAFLRAKRVILAGDHKQLGPTVLSQTAAEQGLAKSLFARLLDMHGDAVKLTLREQYRMNEAIMQFPSETMYDGALRAATAVADWTLDLGDDFDATPFVFVDTAGKGFDEERVANTESLANPGEARLVAAYVKHVCDRGLPKDQVSVIAPYSGQVAALKKLLPDIAIDTVDAFQGQENELVVVSLTRSNPEGNIGFLAHVNRTHVAITRAKRQLVVIGDTGTLASHPYYAKLIEHAQSTGAYRSAWDWVVTEAD
jgi:ATP-dependent RNA/DNA helicase IGHMBP2